MEFTLALEYRRRGGREIKIAENEFITLLQRGAARGWKQAAKTDSGSPGGQLFSWENSTPRTNGLSRSWYHLLVHIRAILCRDARLPCHLLHRQTHHPLEPTPAATTTKDDFCLLKINKKGEPHGKGKRDYSFLHDAFKQTATGIACVKQTATGIECVVCGPGPGPGGFSFAWDDLDPPDGTQRQLNKGNLALHVENNQMHHEHAKATADKASRKAGGGGRFLSYSQRASAPPPSPPPPHPPSLLMVVV